MKTPWIAIAVVTLAATVVGVVLTAVPAQAHDGLLGVTPADGASVAESPAAVVLEFGDDIQQLGSAVVVRGEDGTIVSSGPLGVAGPTVTQPLVPLTADGTYQVSFRVVSADGHPVSGSTTFTAVGLGVAMSPAAPQAPGVERSGATDLPSGVWVGAGVVLVLALLLGLRARRKVAR